MNRSEKSLLLFFASRSVNYGGRVNLVHMNDGDTKIAEKWNKDGYVKFGRIKLENQNSDGSSWCRLSAKAWTDAHKERRARSDRMWKKRMFKKTGES